MANNTPPSFYRFRGLNSNSLTELSEGKLWFGDARTFNDPFEFVFTINPEEPNPERKEHFDIRKDHTTDPEFVETMSNLFFSDRKSLEVVANVVLDTVFTNSSACCFSSDVKHPSFWSYYADNHLGFSIEYDPNSNFFDDIQKVEYTEQSIAVNDYRRKFVNEENSEELKQIFTRIMTHKGVTWTHEKEWRILRFEPAGLVEYPEDAIKSIHFGVRMREDQKTLIERITQNRYTYYDVGIDRRNYALVSKKR